MRIFDCFTFFNEIDLLKIRLSLLNEVVDYFVIVEMNKTFTGINKNFNLEANKAFFDEYREKIIYLKIKDIPNFKGIDDVEWEREYFQRNCIMRGIVNCEPSDIIIISDVDEIPNPEVLKNILKNKIHWFGQNNIRWIDRIRNIIYKMMLYAENKRISNILDISPVVLEQDVYYYSLNFKGKYKWYGSIICKYKNMSLPQKFRNRRTYLPFIKNAGWHFSSFFGDKLFLEKSRSIVEGNCNLTLKEIKNIRYNAIMSNYVVITNKNDMIIKIFKKYIEKNKCLFDEKIKEKKDISF